MKNYQDISLYSLLNNCRLDLSSFTTYRCDEDRFKLMLNDFAESLGMTYFHLMTIHAASSHEDAPTPIFSFSNFPAEWDEGYFNEQRWRLDPTYNFIHRKLKQQSVVYANWREALEDELTIQREKGDYELYLNRFMKAFTNRKQYNINSGVCIARKNPQNILLLYLSSEETPYTLDNRFDQDFWIALYNGLLIFDDLMNRLEIKSYQSSSIRTPATNDVYLSKREKEIMSFFMHNPNTTIRNVATNHHISENTINFHLKQIRKKLGNIKASGRELALLLKNAQLI